MEPVTLVGTIVRFGARRSTSGDKVKTITLEVFGVFDQLDALMEVPLEITIKERPKGAGL